MVLASIHWFWKWGQICLLLFLAMIKRGMMHTMAAKTEKNKGDACGRVCFNRTFYHLAPHLVFILKIIKGQLRTSLSYRVARFHPHCPNLSLWSPRILFFCTCSCIIWSTLWFWPRPGSTTPLASMRFFFFVFNRLCPQIKLWANSWTIGSD